MCLGEEGTAWAHFQRNMSLLWRLGVTAFQMGHSTCTLKEWDLPPSQMHLRQVSRSTGGEYLSLLLGSRT